MNFNLCFRNYISSFEKLLYSQSEGENGNKKKQKEALMEGNARFAQKRINSLYLFLWKMTTEIVSLKK